MTFDMPPDDPGYPCDCGGSITPNTSYGPGKIWECDRCKFWRTDNVEPIEPCQKCNGRGTILKSHTSIPRQDIARASSEYRTVVCGVCSGTGKIVLARQPDDTTKR